MTTLPEGQSRHMLTSVRAVAAIIILRLAGCGQGQQPQHSESADTAVQAPGQGPQHGGRTDTVVPEHLKGPEPEPTPLAALEARYVEYQADSSDRTLPRLYDAYDALAIAKLGAEPSLSTASLLRWMTGLPHIGEAKGQHVSGMESQGVEVIDLRDGERALIWRGVEDTIWPGGGRVSLLLRGADGWRLLGHSDTSQIDSLKVLYVDRTNGILVMQDAVVAGNGAPPQYGMALAALDGRLLVERTEEFGRVWRDDATGELRLAARGERVNHYPDEPLIEYRWRVGRRGSEIVMERDLLTPWIVALDEYCSGKRPGRGRGRGVADACGSHLDSVARLSSTSIAVRFETGRVFTLAAADGTWDVVRVR